MPLLFRERGRPLPPLLQVSTGPVRVLPGSAPSLHVRILQTHHPSESAAPGADQPSPGCYFPTMEKRTGVAGRSPICHPLRSPCSRSCWSYQGSSSSAVKSSILAALRMAPQAAGGRCGGATQGRGAGPGTMQRRRAEPPASRTRAAAPPPAPRPLAIGRRPLARRRDPARSGSCGAGGTGRRPHKGWRGGDGGRAAARKAQARRQVWGARISRAPRRAPPAPLRPALPRDHPATPRASAASWRGWPRASQAPRSAGWSQLPLTNQETYAKLEAGPRVGSPWRPGLAVAEPTPPSLQVGLQFTSQCLKSFYFVYLSSLSLRRSPESDDLLFCSQLALQHLFVTFYGHLE